VDVSFRVALTRDPIDLAALHGTDSRDGALCFFAGVVRNENGGRPVSFLEYEAYEDMARPLMEEIARETLQRWPVTRVALIHRLGRLEVGEPSVAVAVTAPHREAAFAACRHAIDALKSRVPIWKKEYYTDGSQWLEQSQPPAPTSEGS
jgi:molybdopterin synthase catalytic subunit